MLIKRGKCKSVNATYEIYDDYAKPFTEEGKRQIEQRCTEIIMRSYAEQMAKRNIG